MGWVQEIGFGVQSNEKQSRNWRKKGNYGEGDWLRRTLLVTENKDKAKKAKLKQNKLKDNVLNVRILKYSAKLDFSLKCTGFAQKPVTQRKCGLMT